MFPFQVPNTYLNTQFPYNFNYDFFMLQQLPGNHLFFPYNYQNLNLPHENRNANFISHQQAPCFLPIERNSSPNSLLTAKKRKRITKKLTLTCEEKTVRSLTSLYKAKRSSFKYLDPSRAPPITSLRSDRELELDLREVQVKCETSSLLKDDVLIQESKSTAKLQILLKEPNEKDYPFLICKKRKYHRNSKRRYSVAYFEQRASFIVNKQSIPSYLHPKNKVRKARRVNKRIFQLSYQQSNSFDSQSVHSSFQESSDNSDNSEHLPVDTKKEKNLKFDQNKIKLEVISKEILNQER